MRTISTVINEAGTKRRVDTISNEEKCFCPHCGQRVIIRNFKGLRTVVHQKGYAKKCPASRANTY